MRKRLTAAAIAGALILSGCGSTDDTDTDTNPSTVPPQAQDCTAPVAADTGSVDGWLGYLSENSDDYGLMITPVDGDPIAHNAEDTFPAASAFKVVHLAAYARAVSEGAIDPNAEVSVDEWEKWYFPTDGGAHEASLEYLDLASENGVASDRTATVTNAQLVDVMIRFSDSAAPDLLRERLGPEALSQVMNDYGFPGSPATFLSLYLGTVDPDLNSPESREQAAERYTTDIAYAQEKLAALADIDPALLSDPDAPGAADPTASDIVATPRAMHDLMLAIADGSFGAGTDLARSVLEYQGPDPEGTLIGFKGGSLPGVLTDTFEYRSVDGDQVASATLMVRNLSVADADRNEFTHQQLLLGALTDGDTAAALRCLA